MLEIFCCALDDIDATLLARYRALLSDEELQRSTRFIRPDAERTFVAGRALLRSVLAEKLSCAPQALQFVRDANDKPQLVDHPLHFNLSHGAGWIVLAVSAAPVGVDVETSRRGNNLLGIAERYFSAAEHAQLSALDESARAAEFCALWALKEACVKWCGLGIGRAIAGVGVRVEGDAITLDLRADIAAFGTPAAVLFALSADVRVAAIGVALAPLTISRCLPLVSRELLLLPPLATLDQRFLKEP